MIVLVQAYACCGCHGAGPASRLQPPRTDVIEDWPYLDEAVLLNTRSRKVYMTCYRFRHHAGLNCIPVLTCQRHHALPGLDR